MSALQRCLLVSKYIVDKLKSKKKEWKNEYHFNIFVARKILLPLLGGKCVVNNDHKSVLKQCKTLWREDMPTRQTQLEGIGNGFWRCSLRRTRSNSYPRRTWRGPCSCSSSIYTRGEKKKEGEEINKEKEGSKKRTKQGEEKNKNKADDNSGGKVTFEGRKVQIGSRCPWTITVPH